MKLKISKSNKTFHSIQFQNKKKKKKEANVSFSYLDDLQYKRKNMDIKKNIYGTTWVHLILKKENLIEYQGVKEFKPKYQMKIGQFFYSNGTSTYFTRIFFHNGTKRKNSLIGLDTSYTTHFKCKKPSRQTKNLQIF